MAHGGQRQGLNTEKVIRNPIVLIFIWSGQEDMYQPASLVAAERTITQRGITRTKMCAAIICLVFHCLDKAMENDICPEYDLKTLFTFMKPHLYLSLHTTWLTARTN